MSDGPQQEEPHAKVLQILNAIVLREYFLWKAATEARQPDPAVILKTTTRMETCVEIAHRLGLKIVEPIEWQESDAVANSE